MPEGPCRRIIITTLASLALSAAGGTLAVVAPQAKAGDAAKPVLVFAAASLRTALDAIGARWTAATGKNVVFSYAGSGALARQIENGAPADVFASADAAWMDYAAEKKLIRPETRTSLLGNALVLIAPAAAPIPASLDIRPGFDLAAAIGDSRLAMGVPGTVPAGTYAKAALTSLGVWDSVAAKIAGAESVRAALAFVARGEAALGIVYATDARSEPKVRVVGTFPASSHAPIVYPFALTATSTNPAAAEFLSFLSSSEATRMFTAQGFTVPR